MRWLRFGGLELYARVCDDVEYTLYFRKHPLSPFRRCTLAPVQTIVGFVKSFGEVKSENMAKRLPKRTSGWSSVALTTLFAA